MSIELPPLKLPALPSLPCRSMADHERYIIELREVMRCRERLLEARERILLARIAELESADIHSCHDDCQRLACVQARRIAEMEAVLSETVALYGKPGGPWNIPGDPGGWLERARAAIAGSGVK